MGRGVIPYGYKTVDKQLVIEPVAAKAVEYAFKRYEELGSTLAVARELNAEHPRIDVIKWNSQAVLIVLRNIIYEGFIASKRTGETFKGVHEAIVSPEAFTRVQKALDKTAGTRSSVERRSFVAALKGLLALRYVRLGDDPGLFFL